MGIEKFFNSLSKNKNIKTNDGIVKSIQKKLKCDYLYFDFNSIIYTISSDIERKINEAEAKAAEEEVVEKPKAPKKRAAKKSTEKESPGFRRRQHSFSSFRLNDCSRYVCRRFVTVTSYEFMRSSCDQNDSTLVIVVPKPRVHFVIFQRRDQHLWLPMLPWQNESIHVHRIVVP